MEPKGPGSNPASVKISLIYLNNSQCCRMLCFHNIQIIKPNLAQLVRRQNPETEVRGSNPAGYFLTRKIYSYIICFRILMHQNTIIGSIPWDC